MVKITHFFPIYCFDFCIEMNIGPAIGMMLVVFPHHKSGKFMQTILQLPDGIFVVKCNEFIHYLDLFFYIYGHKSTVVGAKGNDTKVCFLSSGCKIRLFLLKGVLYG